MTKGRYDMLLSTTCLKLYREGLDPTAIGQRLHIRNRATKVTDVERVTELLMMARAREEGR
jgi:hypothetical protein